MKSIVWVGIVLAAMHVGQALAEDAGSAGQDWPNLAAYRSRNAALGLPAKDENRVVFMGDSITEFWDRKASDLFSNKSYINRGISGQTTPQMLLRFRADVIQLKPRVVVILAGTNDIAGNTGPASVEMIVDNIASMAELARAHGIRVVLCAVLPVRNFYWASEIRPAATVVSLNRRISEYAARNGLAYVDYYAPMVDENAGLKREFSGDGVHPNGAGYQVMNPLVEAAIQGALRAK